MKHLFPLLILLGFSPINLTAQEENCDFLVKGTLTDDKSRVIYGKRRITFQCVYFNKGSSEPGTVETESNGSFSICIKIPGKYKDILKNINTLYSLSIEINEEKYAPFKKTEYSLKRESDLGEIKLVRLKDLENPIPTDIINKGELMATGQTSIGRALHYAAPGVNSTSHPVSDATAHLDPTDLRNLGSSRSLILVEGKRKNFGAGLYVNDVVCKGEVGVDIRSIPLGAIERVKIERQEAATLYGSDAIGGIIDFQLKGNHPKLAINTFAGVNSDNLDGFTHGVDITRGIEFGKKGFLTVTYSYFNQDESNRANQPGYDSLITTSTPYREKWIKQNPSLGMRIGEPKMLSNTIFYNAKIDLRGQTQNRFYSFGGLGYRNTISYANYRAPYWIKDTYRIFSSADSSYQGFLPTFESNIRDHFFVFGIEGSSEDGKLEYDISQTVAGNDIDFYVDNSFNPELKGNSPTSFNVGGYNLTNNNTRVDLNWSVVNHVNLRMGGDFRNERYEIKEGEEKSYGREGGTISYPGTRSEDALSVNRNNLGGFALLSLEYDRFSLEGSGRYEKYHKFDRDFAWKVAGLYRLAKNNYQKWVVRASISEGFRAPALQQLYYNKIQTVTTASGVANRGTFSTYSPVVRQLGVKTLQNEDARTFSFGTAANFDIETNKQQLSFAIDYYLINIFDRIALSGNLDSAMISNPNNPVRKILSSSNITSLNFFLNAIDTKHSGIDFNARYVYTWGGETEKQLEINIGSNILLKNEITKFIEPSAIIAGTGVDIFNRKEQSRLLSGRPANKILCSARFSIKDNYAFAVHGFHFGKVSWMHQVDELKDQVFSDKWVFNIRGEAKLFKNLTASLYINNVLNTKPDPLSDKGDPNTNGGGRYLYYREINQFGYVGRSYLLRMLFNI